MEFVNDYALFYFAPVHPLCATPLLLLRLHLRVLVFSAEGKVGVIESLYTIGNIVGYVRKGRDDAKELMVAIPGYLERQGIKPAALSSMEKRLKEMRQALNFSNNEQLAAYCKDIGIV